MKTLIPMRIAAVAGLAVFAAALVLNAQNASAPVAHSTVAMVHVKPDMLNEWLDLQRNEVVPALKKAGVKTRTVYTTGLFGTSGEYVVVTPFEKYAEFDQGSPLIKALGEMAPWTESAGEAVAILDEVLRSSNEPILRVAAAMAIVRFGDTAQGAVPTVARAWSSGFMSESSVT